jgi:hypothetical protein
MSKTLNAGDHRLVFTSGVNDRIAEDSKFAKFVYQSIVRFNRADWGNVDAEDWKANDADLKSLNNGGWYGRILASYDGIIWIIRNTADEDGTQAITVLFPEEY